MKYRKLTKKDFEAYVALRKEALETDPEAFGSNEEKEAGLRAQRYDAMLKSPSNFIIGAFEEEKLIGMCGFMRFTGIKVEHKGMIWGVYCQKKHRQQGVGKQMVAKTLDYIWKEKGMILIQLGVSMNNFPAINLYANLGFESYGVERRALLINGEFLDEYLMAMVRPGIE